MAHVRRKSVDVFVLKGNRIRKEAIERITELYAVKMEALGKPPATKTNRALNTLGQKMKSSADRSLMSTPVNVIVLPLPSLMTAFSPDWLRWLVIRSE